MHPPAQIGLDWCPPDPPPAVQHSDTSRAAARQIAPLTRSIREAVYSALQAAGGLTDEEIQQRLSLNPSTQRPRRIELVRAGRVADSGQTRRTHSGRLATVWVAL